MTGVETLIRWQHPEWGEVLPERFISIAEDSGLIIPIGKWVIREACLHLKRWASLGLNGITVAVNISALEFVQKNFIQNIQKTLKETHVDAGCLELEITESVLMRDAKSNIAILHQLKAMGLLLVVDDFGTGYSSLSYLKKFPIDVLKIDQSFVQEMDTSAEDRIIVGAIINMANSLNLKVIAEGVEKQAHQDFLVAHDCLDGQGNYLCKPLTASEFERLFCNTD